MTNKSQLYQVKEIPLEAPFQHKIVTVRKARKEYPCSHCPQIIQKGEEYCEVVASGSGLGGLKYPNRTHLNCLDSYLRKGASHITRVTQGD